MEDAEIIKLYLQRNEAAIAETDKKYGAYCYAIASNLLSVREDAQECVNDAYHQAWTHIPPEQPDSLKAWLGSVVRNLSINLWHKNHALKRNSDMDILLSELEDCIPSSQNTESQTEAAELGRIISSWLYTLPKNDRVLFVRRYWHGVPLNELAKDYKLTPAKLAQKMYRLRRSLKMALEKEGISL